MKRAPLITGLLLISTSCAYASSGGCGADSTSGATNYSSVVDDVTVNQTDNVTGREFTSATLSSTNWQYACSCSAGKAVKLVYMVSPVLTTTGHQTGYYKLNDSLDIKTTLQANDIPGLTTDQVVSVNTRFTQIKNNTVYSAATQTGVCQGDTSRYGPVNIGANTTFTLYVTGFAPIFPDTCYHLTHYWLAAVDIPVASDNPVHYADAIRYNARTPLQGSLLPLTRLVWA
ncbi:putative prophage side tail fiber protein [Escherichia coli 1-110-08_S1_C3]|nr:putative prophage side tail fiber protein [Escherichia coli 1-110-08_S1_C3]EYE33560.1 putative prophage side tail fiber protein [Escherichia coli 1-110-08_S1_C1]